MISFAYSFVFLIKNIYPFDNKAFCVEKFGFVYGNYYLCKDII